MHILQSVLKITPFENASRQLYGLGDIPVGRVVRRRVLVRSRTRLFVWWVTGLPIFVAAVPVALYVGAGPESAAGLPSGATTNGTAAVVIGRGIQTGHLKALVWDAESKEYTAKAGETNATLTFGMTNTSPSEVIIRRVRSSCGCTITKLPRQPCVLRPGENSQLAATINLRGKYGTLNKHLIVETSIGTKILAMKFVVPRPAGTSARAENRKAAQADRQAVFQGRCAECHVAPTKGLLRQALYDAACGICHDAEPRATMVPDLHAVKTPQNRSYWRTWTAEGQAGTLMPAFDAVSGGPLNTRQIDSLVDYLTTQFK